MEEKKNNSFLNLLNSLAFMFIVFVPTGFIVILASRLFTKITKLPKLFDCFWVGAACWWIGLSFFYVHDDDKPKIDTNIFTQGYEYTIDGPTITMVHPLKAETEIRPYIDNWVDERYRKINLNIIGMSDGINKIYNISTNPNQVIEPEFLAGHGSGLQLSADDNVKGVFRVLKRKHQEDSSANSKFVWSILIIGAGIICLLSAQFHAYKDDQTLIADAS